MATLYVENVPEELYDALKQRARGRRKSISAEVLDLLSEHIPTEAELARRRSLLRQALKLQRSSGAAKIPFPQAEEMQREDRGR